MLWGPTVSNNFQPLAQHSSWQKRHQTFSFSSSHCHRRKQNYIKTALWTSPSSAQLCFLHFIYQIFELLCYGSLRRRKQKPLLPALPKLGDQVPWSHSLSVGAHSSKPTPPGSSPTSASDGKHFFRGNEVYLPVVCTSEFGNQFDSKLCELMSDPHVYWRQKHNSSRQITSNG